MSGAACTPGGSWRVSGVLGYQVWWGKAVLGWRQPTTHSHPAVENQAHCDFVKLRNMLIRTHMHDLKDVTCDVHYENYRAHCIQQMTRCAPQPRARPRPSGPAHISMTEGQSCQPTQT